MPIAGSRARIGLLGGSFDPIHVGHLALGRAAAIALPLDEVRLIPTGQSWQKDPDQTPALHRLAMTRIAVDSVRARDEREGRGRDSNGRDGSQPGARWSVDDIEVRRDGPSYTIDTLIELRRRLGPDPALVLVLGSDQIRNLATWQRWRELLDHAHIAVTRREQVPLSDLPPEVDAWYGEHGADSLGDGPAGRVVSFRMPAVAVSASGIRQQLLRGEDPGELLPPGVLDYLRRHRLYENG